MEQRCDTVVITSAEGFPTVQISDTSGSHPTVQVSERSVDGASSFVRCFLGSINHEREGLACDTTRLPTGNDCFLTSLSSHFSLAIQLLPAYQQDKRPLDNQSRGW